MERKNKMRKDTICCAVVVLALSIFLKPSLIEFAYWMLIFPAAANARYLFACENITKVRIGVFLCYIVAVIVSVSLYFSSGIVGVLFALMISGVTLYETIKYRRKI